jgi:hypothetical protein
MKRRILILACVAVGAGCAPTYHTPPAYRYDRPRAAALEIEAAAECRAAVGPAHVPKRTFVTDGCTLWPDTSWTGISWQACCIKHDMAYWCGGSSEQRRKADQALAQCVDDAYAAWLGPLMSTGTRAFAGRLIPAHWRWGYGHDYPAAD